MSNTSNDLNDCVKALDGVERRLRGLAAELGRSPFARDLNATASQVGAARQRLRGAQIEHA